MVLPLAGANPHSGEHLLLDTPSSSAFRPEVGHLLRPRQTLPAPSCPVTAECFGVRLVWLLPLTSACCQARTPGRQQLNGRAMSDSAVPPPHGQPDASATEPLDPLQAFAELGQ